MSTVNGPEAAVSCSEVAERTIRQHASAPGGLGAWLRTARAPLYARLCASYVGPDHWREIVLYLIEVAGGLAVDAIEERPELARQHLDHKDLEPLLASPVADVRQSALLLLGVLGPRGSFPVPRAARA